MHPPAAQVKCRPPPHTSRPCQPLQHGDRALRAQHGVERPRRPGWCVCYCSRCEEQNGTLLWSEPFIGRQGGAAAARPRTKRPTQPCPPHAACAVCNACFRPLGAHARAAAPICPVKQRESHALAALSLSPSCGRALQSAVRRGIALTAALSPPFRTDRTLGACVALPCRGHAQTASW